MNMYSVSLNGFRDAITCDECGSDLGVVRRSNWAVSAFACFIASARCDSTLSAVLKAFDATVCALAASASACATSRCLLEAFASASLASARASSAMPLTASASSCAILADVAASPASFSAAVNFATSYSWMALCASSSLAPHLHSPTTPITTIINPIRRSRFTHLGSSECDCGCSPLLY